ncbi:MAG: hypothetical protein ACFHX7_19520 [Pseudomonadota bacterium]
MLVLSLLAALTACTTTPDAISSSEQLLIQPPAGWKQVYQFNNSETRLADFVPPDESALIWQEKLSLESHARLKTTDPIEILLAEVRRLQDTCTFVQHFNLFAGLENDYPTSVRLIMCGENRSLAKGEVSLNKAIQGEDYLYIIRLTRRVPPFEPHQPEVRDEEVADWATFMQRVSLCNPDRGNAHPCPQ